MVVVMDDNLKKRFTAIEKLVRDAINSYLSEYSVKTDIRDISAVLEGNENNEGPYFVMDIVFSSVAYNKILKFDFSNGPDNEGEYYKSVDFLLSNESNWFSYEDYLKFKSLNKDYNRYFQTAGTLDTLDKVKDFIKQIVFMLKQDDIQHILTSKNWLKVPHDKSMYF